GRILSAKRSNGADCLVCFILLADISVVFMPVCTPLGQGLSAQLLVEEGNGKPPHHHPSYHFPNLDDTGVSPLSVITDLPYGRALIIIIIINYSVCQSYGVY